MPYFFSFRRLNYLFFVGFISVLFCSCKFSSKELSKQKTDQPNVLLIMTDDQGWGDFGVNGNDSVDTPVLNSLAREGIQFDRFYVSPVCAPTRASLLTGRYHLRTGTSWVTHRMEVMQTEELTLAELLKEEGYQTGCFGKWHNGEQYPNNAIGQGFDEFFGFSAGHWNNYFNTSLDSNGVHINTQGYISDVLTDASIRFIERNKNTPFFCYVPFNAPHGPFQVPEKYFRKYKDLGFNDKDACVYGMCENIDDNVGKILNTIDSLELTSNTIVLFLTDNGPNGVRYNGGMKGHKGKVDEGGVRVPLFIRYPARFKTAFTVEEISAHIDILPTIAELCGIPIPVSLELDGISLVPLMENTGKPVWNERNIFTHQVHQGLKKTPGAVRNSRYRLVIYEDKDTLLYDMLKDPGQISDIASSSPEILGEMLLDYDNWYADVIKDFQGSPSIPVGYMEFPTASLPAPESQLFGDLKFKGKMGWANDWIINWSSQTDKAEWIIDVVEDGDFEVSMEYALAEEGKGTEVKLLTNEGSLVIELARVVAADYLPSPDRVVRGEVYERNWGTINLGNVHLSSGTQSLQLKASKIMAPGSFELKSLSLKRY